MAHGNGTVSFIDSNSQSITGSGIIANSLYNVIINNTSGGVSIGITGSNDDVTVGNQLTMSNGILTTSANNLLIVTNNAVAGIIGGSSTSFINGPVRWNTSLNATYNFPVGKGNVYLPLVLKTNANTGTTAQAEAFNSNSGGTANFTIPTGVATVGSISTTEYWSLVTTGTFTNSTVSVSRPTAISPFDLIAGSTTSNGTYTSLAGTVGTNGITNSNAIGSNRFFVFGRKHGIRIDGAIAGSPFCAGSPVSVKFKVTGSYPSGNVFKAQLSDVSGNFSSPTEIGSVTLALTGGSDAQSSGTINATIPTTTAAGTGYRIRMVSTAPNVIGEDNGTNLIIRNTPTVGLISTPAELCSGGLLNPTAPAVTINGSAVTASGWQLEVVVGSGTYSNIAIPYTVSIADNGKKLRYYATNGCGTTYSNLVVITVNPAVVAGTVSYTSNSICIGNTATYSSNGTSGGTWSSSNPAVATVNAAGIVTGITSGTAMITYTVSSSCGSSSASQQITVNALPIASVSGKGSTHICSTANAVFTITGTLGSTVNYTLNSDAAAISIPASGTVDVTVTNAVADQTLNIISVGNGSCTNAPVSTATVIVGANSIYTATGWSNGIPSDGISAVIANDYNTEAGGSFTACSCTVNSGATLTIAKDTYVEVQDNINNNGKLIVESDGNLKQNNQVTNTTSITVRRLHHLSEKRLEYNFISSPVANQNMKMIFGNNAANVPFVTVLRESTNSFVNATLTDYAVVAKGFSVKEPRLTYVDLSGDSLPVNEAQYKGVPNNGDITLAFPTYTAGRGYNLVGNPYPSNLDIIDLYNDPETQNINPEFRFWDNSVNDIYTQMGGAYQGYSYAIFNAATDTDGIGLPAPGRGGVENGVPYPAGSKPPGRVIKVSQGFMVRATGAGGQLAFKNSMRRTSNEYTEFFGKTSPKNRYRLQLVKSDGFTVQNAIAYFATGNQNLGLEDTRIPNASASDALFTYAGDSKVVINGRSAFATTDVLTLGARHYTAGTYKIKAVDEEGVFANGQAIYLKDKQQNIITDLTQGDYTFTSEAGEFTNRFEIVYENEIVLATDAVTKASLEVYRDAADFVIRSSDKAIETMELYDASGRLVLSQKGNGKELRFSATRLAEGMYVVKTRLKDGQELTKKIRK